MTATLQFDPETFSKPVLRLILAAAQLWNCSPQDALNRLLDDMARRAGFTPSQPLP